MANSLAYDYSELDGKITTKYKTHAIFAEKLGMSERTFSLKFNSIRDFKQDEIIRSCQLLAIDEEEIVKYFFTRKVQ